MRAGLRAAFTLAVLVYCGLSTPPTDESSLVVAGNALAGLLTGLLLVFVAMWRWFGLGYVVIGGGSFFVAALVGGGFTYGVDVCAGVMLRPCVPAVQVGASALVGVLFGVYLLGIGLADSMFEPGSGWYALPFVVGLVYVAPALTLLLFEGLPFVVAAVMARVGVAYVTEPLPPAARGFALGLVGGFSALVLPGVSALLGVL